MFGLHRPGWAWLALGAALVLAFLCLGWFRALSRPAAAALAPFTAWMAFLWAWSLALWTLNGGFLGRFLA
jgi:tryptophan-rich sensory protein